MCAGNLPSCTATTMWVDSNERMVEEKGKQYFNLQPKSKLPLDLYGPNRVDIHFPQSLSLKLIGYQNNVLIFCVSGLSHNLLT